MLKDKTALITGGSSGIRLATAKRFRAEGARVAITGTDASRLEVAHQEIGPDTLAIRAAELVDRNIRVNAVSPGPIDTPIHRARGQTEEAFRPCSEKLDSKVPAGRMGKPEEIAAAVLFLAGEESRYLLGAEINVDGGLAEL